MELSSKIPRKFLSYANDIVITGRRKQDVEEALIALVNQTKKMDLKINRL